jgi:hypothetical protein
VAPLMVMDGWMGGFSYLYMSVPCAQVFEFYFRSYLSQWSQSVFSDALHSIPQVSWVLSDSSRQNTTCIFSDS